MADAAPISPPSKRSFATRLKSGLKNLSVLLSSVAIACVALEVFCRISFSDTIVLFNRFHSTVSYGDITTRRLRPNTVFYHQSIDGRWQFRTNEKGFRQDWPSPYEKPANTLRILVLGDSHAQGMEVNQDQTFSWLLNGKDCRGKKIETLNAAISGSGTSEQLVFYQFEGKKYQPDVVVLAFFFNDFDNNMTAFHKLENDGELVLFRRVHPATKGLRVLEMHNNIGILSWLSQNSYAYSVALNSAWEFGKKVFYGSARSDLVQKEESDDPRQEKYKVAMMDKILAALADEVNSTPASLIVVDIPGLGSSAVVSSIYYRPLPALEQRKIPVLSIAELRNESYFVPHGHRHINASAHRKIADELYIRLCR